MTFTTIKPLIFSRDRAILFGGAGLIVDQPRTNSKAQTQYYSAHNITNHQHHSQPVRPSTTK